MMQEMILSTFFAFVEGAACFMYRRLAATGVDYPGDPKNMSWGPNHETMGLGVWVRAKLPWFQTSGFGITPGMGLELPRGSDGDELGAEPREHGEEGVAGRMRHPQL